MSGLNLLRIPIHAPPLLRFAAKRGITQEDETLGYTLHAWLAALFGDWSPKPFRYIERRGEMLAYTRHSATELLERAQASAARAALLALDHSGVASKPMPPAWRPGTRVALEVLSCPVTRKDDEEKDVYLRALDRLGEAVPPRGEVYRDWFVRQWDGAARLEQVNLLGMTTRSRLLRRARGGQNRLKVVERPSVLFATTATVEDGDRFAELLARGIGRHRAFGFGMVLLSPPR